MRINLIAFIVGITFFSVAASSARGQGISLTVTNASIEKVFEAIKKQSSYGFLYNKETFKGVKPVTLNIKNLGLKAVLDRCFEGQPLTYYIIDNTIVVKPKEKTILERVGEYLQNITVSGKVLDENGMPLAGVNVILQGTTRSTITDEKGLFSMVVPNENAVLLVRLIGYEPYEIIVKNNSKPTIVLKPNVTLLDEAGINTGFDKIPKERATGSFTLIDNTLINRSVSTNILDRLDGVTSGLIFTKGNSISAPRSSIEIRGRSTLFSSAEPLIVVDNFAYDGNLANINPNDVESITILKDAAAASIWGSRSGNGVIVITTKKGKLNTTPKISFNANVNIGGKPNLYYTRQLSSGQFLEVERFLFDKGTYNASINNGYSLLSPAVEIMLARRNGTITAAQETEQLNLLASYDVREQQLKYLNRVSVDQQYQASISGGGNSQNYFVSIGYDKGLPNDVSSNSDRITINANNTYYLLKDKFEFFTGIVYTGSKTVSGVGAIGNLSYPYTRLADEDGNALVVPTTLRPSYIATAGGGKLLNWTRKPLEDLENGYNKATTNLTDYRLNLSLRYKIIKGLSATLYYNYEKGLSQRNTLNELESYTTRSLINQYTQINATTRAVTYPLPMGSILRGSSSTIRSNNGRFQINYENKWNKHAVNLLSGTEIRDYESFTGSNVFYGYNDDTKINQNAAVNTTVNFPLFYGSGTSRISIDADQQGNTNRYLSYYLNGSYSYDERYIASFSARKDESNIFGVATNQKGVPLWSAGLAWAISKESFYKLEWLQQLKLRTTFGYTGNSNNSISAYLTATSSTGGLYNTYNATIQNPPNPSLRWEKNQNLNIGLDFATLKNRLSGSIDFWRKKGLDLIGSSPIAPQTGIALYTGNSANTLTKGVDVELHSINVNGSFKWYTSLLYNYSQSKVTQYKVSNGSNYNVVSSNYNNPLEGYPYYALFSFKYAGLDNTGNPQGYLNGTISTDYAAIRNSIDRNELVFSGSAIPTSFGGIRNTFSYLGVDLSFNITYKFGYYFRRNSLDNDSIYGGGAVYQMADYDKRWQNPGDEVFTNVPGLIYPSNNVRTSMYLFSNALVKKGDHIRLRDIRFGYTLPKFEKFPFRSLNLFAYANNIGLIWRANKQKIDPDFVLGIPSARTIAFGLRADL